MLRKGEKQSRTNTRVDYKVVGRRQATASVQKRSKTGLARVNNILFVEHRWPWCSCATRESTVESPGENTKWKETISAKDDCNRTTTTTKREGNSCRRGQIMMKIPTRRPRGSLAQTGLESLSIDAVLTHTCIPLRLHPDMGLPNPIGGLLRAVRGFFQKNTTSDI